MNDLIYVIYTNVWYVVIGITSNVNIFDYVNKLIKKISNNSGPITDPCFTLNINIELLWDKFILVHYFLFGKYSRISFNNVNTNPYALRKLVTHAPGNQKLLIDLLAMR